MHDTTTDARGSVLESWSRTRSRRKPRNVSVRQDHDLDDLRFRHDLSEHRDHLRIAIVRPAARCAHSIIVAMDVKRETSVERGAR